MPKAMRLAFTGIFNIISLSQTKIFHSLANERAEKSTYHADGAELFIRFYYFHMIEMCNQIK